MLTSGVGTAFADPVGPAIPESATTAATVMTSVSPSSSFHGHA